MEVRGETTSFSCNVGADQVSLIVYSSEAITKLSEGKNVSCRGKISRVAMNALYSVRHIRAGVIA